MVNYKPLVFPNKEYDDTGSQSVRNLIDKLNYQSRSKNVSHNRKKKSGRHISNEEKFNLIGKDYEKYQIKELKKNYVKMNIERFPDPKEEKEK